MSPRGRIGRFGRVPRRPDHWASPHERARVRAAERLDAPLPATEAAWLEAHLADCSSCREIADAYVDDRLALRELREAPPEPPRDLWARTATRIEQESASKRLAPRPDRPAARRSLPSLGVLSGLAVVTVVVIATAVSGGFLRGITQDAATPSIALASQAAPRATAFPVPAGSVHWLGAIAEDGVFAYNVADVRAVCPPDRRPVCAPFEDGHAKRVTLAATPRFVYQSPVDDQAIVVGTDSTGADAVIVLPLPTPDATPSPTPEATATASAPESGQPSPSVEATPTSETPSSSPSPSVLVTSFPSDVPIESVVVVSPSDLGSPEATAGPIAIITDVIVVGRTAAYSPDGTWFAFTARPADGSAGPDIYVWPVGQPQAYPLTTDHASVFASWVGGSILGSRVGSPEVLPSESATPEPSLLVSNPVKPSPPVEPTIEVPPPIDLPPADVASALGIGRTVATSPVPDASQALQAVMAAESMPQTFLLDPATGAEVPLADAEWHPAVDPTGLAVVAWQGTVGVTDDGLTATPANGNLVIHPFHGPLERDEPSAPSTEVGSLEPSPTMSLEPTPPEIAGSPSASASGIDSASPSASTAPEVVRDFPTQVVAPGPIADFDARWDDTGSWLAIWIADPVNPGLGRLSLLHFDPYTGMLDRPLGAPQDVTALEGFSIGLGRLAWVSPRGQGGEGSRIQIAAWADGQVGSIESIPVDGAIVVQ